VVNNPKFAALLNARWVRPTLRSNAGEVAEVVKHIAGLLIQDYSLYRRSPRNPRALLKCIRHLVLNALCIRYSDPSRFVAMKVRARASRQGFGSRVLVKVLQGLKHQQLIQRQRGYQDRRQGGRSFVTRIRATDKLGQMATQFAVQPHMIEVGGSNSVIELRYPKAKKGPYKGRIRRCRWPQDGVNQTELKRMKGNLENINDAMAKCFIGLHATDAELQEINRRLGRKRDEWRWVDFFDKRLHRVFNDKNPRLGGRFFGGWWQAIPSEFRKFIHIAGEGEEPIWTTELDYGAMHPTLLYARVGIQPPEDCYAINELFTTNREARKYAKQAVLIMLNEDNRRSAQIALYNALAKDFSENWEHKYGEPPPSRKLADILPEGCPRIKVLMDQLIEFHQPIARFFFTGVGKELMYQESNIAERVMLQMIKWGTVALPIHDSFLVREDRQGDLWEVMQEEFVKETGFTCQIEPDQTELDDYKDRFAGIIDEVGREHLIRSIRAGGSQYGIYGTLKADWMRSQCKQVEEGKLQKFRLMVAEPA